MKFYYIDDSYFHSSNFSQEMRKRLFHLCQNQDIHIIFVSGENADAEALERFLAMCNDFHIQVLMSPATFEIDGVKGVLSMTSLYVDGFDTLYSYSGSLMYGDCEAHQSERIYLELFLKHEVDMFVDVLSDELEHVLKDLIQKKGKTKNNKYN